MISTLLVILLIIFGLSTAIIAGKLIRNAVKSKSRFWGLNLTVVSCPACGSRLPFYRKPESIRQELWGGWTCPGCTAELDRHGTDISDSAKSKSLNSQFGATASIDKNALSPIERVFEEDD